MAQVSGGLRRCKNCGRLAEFISRVHPWIGIALCRGCAREHTRSYLRLAPAPMRRELLDSIKRLSEPLLLTTSKGKNDPKK
jgi:ribosomal protein S14